MKTAIRTVESDHQVRACYVVMRQLRPHFTLEAFVVRVRLQQSLGYRLVCLEGEGRPVAVAGYQIRETFADGRFLHLDDLVTLNNERSRGYGAELLQWLAVRARELNCESLQLDSAVWREEAHRFYEREGLSRIAYHFALPTKVSPEPHAG
jgi:GNAT superfamily N-acetyltransferase